MSEEKRIYSKDKVDNDEKIVRFILYPRDWNIDLDELADEFVKLKHNEEGVSCIRHDFLGGQDATMHKGHKLAESATKRVRKKNPQAPEQILKGWGHCTAQEIIDIDPDVIYLCIEKPEQSPEHVEIRFKKDNSIIKGIVKDSYILELFDLIESTFEYQYFSEAEEKQVQNT